MIKFITFAIILLFYPFCLDAGTSEAEVLFLIIYPGARPVGMGAAFWLPGLYPGMYYNFLGYVHPINQGAIGGHIIYFTTGETVGVDEYGHEIGRWRTWDASVKVS
ncbi:MAG: hypothetical protein QMD71_05650 [bacterium]|nr:hypothetical protein [bacterium]